MDIITNFIWLVMTVYFEAQGEPTEGRIMVAHSIMNRAYERKISIKEVVLQPKQYSCWNSFNETGVMPSISFTKEFVECYDDCLKALKESRNRKFGGNTNHYFNPKKCKPAWSKNMELIAEIGNHIFLKG